MSKSSFLEEDIFRDPVVILGSIELVMELSLSAPFFRTMILKVLTFHFYSNASIMSLYLTSTLLTPSVVFLKFSITPLSYSAIAA